MGSLLIVEFVCEISDLLLRSDVTATNSVIQGKIRRRATVPVIQRPFGDQN